MQCKNCGQHHNEFGSFVNGAIWGALVGAVLGMLYAPEKGTDSRKKLQKSLDDLSEKGKELYDETKDLASDFKVAAKPLISELEKNIKPVLEKAKNSSQSVQEQVIERIEQLVEDASTSGYDESGDNLKKYFKGAKKK